MILFLVIILVAALLFYTVIMAGALKPAARRSRRSGKKTYRTNLDRSEIMTRWTTIEAMAAGGGNGMRQAISEADKLVDHALMSLGVRGETMGERLKLARPRFGSVSTYDALWRAHKLRNALAHEVGFDLVAGQAREALTSFERALKDLGAL